jgi:AMIN domain
MNSNPATVKRVMLQPWVLGGAIAAIGMTATAAQAAPLEEFQYDPQTEQISFVLPDGVVPNRFMMAQPARVVIDIPNTQIGDLPLEQQFDGAVKRIELVQSNPQLARVIVEMSPQATFERGQVNFQNVGDAAPQKDRWVLKLLLKSKGALPAGRPAPASPIGESAPTPTPIAAKLPTETLAERAARKPGSQPSVTPASPIPVAIAPSPLPNLTPEIVAKPPTPAIVAKPAPAVELPPGMEGVVDTVVPTTVPTPAPIALLPPQPIVPIAVVPRTPIVPTPAPVVPDLSNVPIARLPEAPAANVPPPPPLLQASIINRAPANPNGPAASVMPTPVMRPDLQSSGGSSPLVSVPPLASITPVTPIAPVPSSPSLLEIPGLPPAPSQPIASSPMPAPLPTLAPAAPNQTVPNRNANRDTNRDTLPPLPDVSLRSGLGNATTATPVPSLFPPAPQFGTLPSTPAPVMVAAALPSTGVVEFGQRLPGPTTTAALPTLPSGYTVPPTGGTVIALDNLTTGGVVLPAGTLLSLRYEQPQSLKLNSGQRQQGLLTLQSPIVDSQGRLLASAGSMVLGEFITSGEGSQFTTQSLTVANRNLSLLAQSDVLRSTKQVKNNRLLQNSGIGAVAGAILGGLNGSVLGGAAAGAAITYAISPKETTLQPGQVLQVKLLQDFFAAR